MDVDKELEGSFDAVGGFVIRVVEIRHDERLEVVVSRLNDDAVKGEKGMMLRGKEADEEERKKNSISVNVDEPEGDV